MCTSRVFAAALVILTSLTGAHGENLQKIHPVDDDLHGALTALFLESGLSLPFSSRPYSSDEVKRSLALVDRDRLSPAGERAYAYVASRLSDRALIARGESMRLNASVEVNLETYLQTNQDNARWEYGYEARRPLLNIPLELWLHDSFYADVEFPLKEAHDSVGNPDLPPNLSNIPDTLYYLDSYFPFRAFLSAGGDNWNVQFGRDRLSWGNGRTGNFMLSSYSDFYDFLRATTYWDVFKFSTVYAVFDPWGDDARKYKAFIGHRIEARILKRIGVAVSESMIAGGDSFPDLVRELNSLMVYHSWTIPERMNSLLTIELDVNPWRYLSLYGQYCIDDLSTKYEQDRGDAKPNLTGFLAGAEVFYPLGPGYIRLFGEYAHTDPFLYLHRHWYLKYTNQRRIWSHIGDSNIYVLKPVGYRFGNDAIVHAYGIGYDAPGFFSAGFDVGWRIKGENDLRSPYRVGEAALVTTPSGENPETTLVLRVGGRAWVLPDLEIGTELSWLRVRNLDHVEGNGLQDLQWIAFARYRL